jgi:hypothetical protein
MTSAWVVGDDNYEAESLRFGSGCMPAVGTAVQSMTLRSGATSTGTPKPYKHRLRHSSDPDDVPDDRRTAPA